jgi:hypothetical protein
MYENFNGETVVEDFYFHLSKAELIEMEMSHEGGLSEALQKIIIAEDAKSIIAEFKNIVLGAYGQKSEDGRRFIKNQQLREEFESTEAYSTLFMELVTNTDAAIEFINGVIPQGLAEEAAKIVDKRALASVPEPTTSEDAAKNEVQPRVVSRRDIELMTQVERSELGHKLATGEIVIAE